MLNRGILLLYATQALAQNSPRACLWQVSKLGSRHTSYLGGTFHEVNGPYFSSLPAAAQRLAQADLLERSGQDAQREEEAQEYVTWSALKWWALLTSPQRETFAGFVAKAEDTTYYQQSPLLVRPGLFRRFSSYLPTKNPAGLSGGVLCWQVAV